MKRYIFLITCLFSFVLAIAFYYSDLNELFLLDKSVRLKEIKSKMLIMSSEEGMEFMQKLVFFALKLRREKEEKILNPEVKIEGFKYLYGVDGDTVKLQSLDGKYFSIRLIGVDTPESNITRYGYKECYGEEAKKFLSNLIGDVLYIGVEFDDSQGVKDKYSRMLGYLWLNGKNINKEIIKNGYGFEYTYKKDNPYKYQNDFKKSEADAKYLKKGLWSGSTCNGLRTKVKESDSLSCGPKQYCNEMQTCEEALYYYNTCGLKILDNDGDGMPCESMCNK